MQTLDVISVNLWQILISLTNLVLLFLILKKFLFAPVKNVLAKRQSEIDQHYSAAETAEEQASRSRLEWAEKLSTADAQADAILQNAAEQAKSRGDRLVADAQEKADSIIRMAQNEAELERRKAADDIKREIVEVSGILAEKILEREIHSDDHRALFDSFIEKLGDSDD